MKLLDEQGREVPRGQRGRIFAANEMVFEGYTGGGGKEIVDGLMSTGDVGHFDAAGRLFVDGRDDEMIVSGGENVFPREVEDLLADHEQIEEAAVIGVDDEEFGQRLKAFVVPRGGAQLSEDTVKELREGEPRPVQGPARGRVPRGAPAQRDGEGAQARAADLVVGLPSGANARLCLGRWSSSELARGCRSRHLRADRRTSEPEHSPLDRCR